MRILLAEDDTLLGDGLRAGLRQQGFQVDWVRDGAAAERELRAEPYAAAVLDLGLPLMDGMDVLAAVRRAGVTLPVLVLTARDARARPYPRPGPAGRRLRASSRWTCTSWRRACVRWCAVPTASRRSTWRAGPACSTRPARACCRRAAGARCPRASSTCCRR